jgi:TolA-binding protein
MRAARNLMLALTTIGAAALVSGPAAAADPTAAEALRLAPIQPDVNYDRPTAAEAAKCRIQPVTQDGKRGWVVLSPSGVVLRRFLDTNGDKVVDLWCYYSNGIEVYRDIDSDFNRKADQYRWLNLAGTRWGLDPNEDQIIDSWREISAEEATAEVVAALASRDVARFRRVLLTGEDLKAVGLRGQRATELQEKSASAAAAFERMAASQKLVNNRTIWTHFGGSQPGVVPADGDGVTTDLLVYENVVAMVETEGKHGQVYIGTMIRTPGGWRVAGMPQPVEEGQAQAPEAGIFFAAHRANVPESETAGPDAKTQQLLAELEKLDEQSVRAQTPEEIARLTERRAELLEQIAEAADEAEDRPLWYRQLADTLSAAAQTGAYPAGIERLKALEARFAAAEGMQELVAYVKFRRLTAEYAASLAAENANFPKIQTQWLENLRSYVEEFPNSPDTAEAMLQLALAEEFAGQDDDAKGWYGKIVQQFPDSPTAKKAAGAVTRLDSVGKVLDLKGSGIHGKLVDLAQYRKKVVLIQFWSTTCEPALNDMEQIKELLARYGKDFAVIGIALDHRKEDVQSYLKAHPLPWAQIYEPGGLESRLANELGILTLPTMLLIDQKGKVVNRNVHISELARELKALLR